MPLSAFDLFKIGIGPSSSHTVGPMRAAHRFLLDLETRGLLARTARIETALYGSLALTGKGHDTDKAVILGLSGELPETVDPDAAAGIVAQVRKAGRLRLPANREIAFDEAADLLFLQRETLPRHPNGMRFRAFDADGGLMTEDYYFSVGGGFVLSEAEAMAGGEAGANIALPHPFHSAAELLAIGEIRNMPIADIVMANELSWRDAADVRAGLLHIWQVMEASIERGTRASGILPGGLRVRRRAPLIHHELTSRPEAALRDQLTVLDWVNLYALAVNEENAAGGRVVTAPTNGAAGVVPAVIRYYRDHCLGASHVGIRDFLLTAAAIGGIIRANASISGAEVGCQGEVGSAAAMAAAGLCAALGGSNAQVENAAEIALEHHLGMTCDPAKGLVQVPCIERNGLGAIKAVAAASLALRGDGTHIVPLDACIETMRQTGHDMSVKYKETSTGGLAVNLPGC